MLPLMYTFISILSLLIPVFGNAVRQDPLPSLSASDLLRLPEVSDALALNDTAQPRCFTKGNWRKVYRPECYQLLYNMLILDGAASLHRWDPASMELPRVYPWRSCVVHVFATEPYNPETFTVLTIARTAALIIRECLTQPKGDIGGTARIGSHGSFVVSVSGPMPRGQTIETA